MKESPSGLYVHAAHQVSAHAHAHVHAPSGDFVAHAIMHARYVPVMSIDEVSLLASLTRTKSKAIIRLLCSEICWFIRIDKSSCCL